ncbi:hypothetical protein Tco_0157393 [Tanacetum coccineum]
MKAVQSSSHVSIVPSLSSSSHVFASPVIGETSSDGQLHSRCLLIMEYLVNISKRRTFWSLNEDILKITILKTNTSYLSRKIRRIRVCTHQRPQGNEAQYAVVHDKERHFKTLSLDELRSPDFNLLSDQEYSEEEVAETMAETMEQYMSKTRAD